MTSGRRAIAPRRRVHQEHANVRYAYALGGKTYQSEGITVDIGLLRSRLPWSTRETKATGQTGRFSAVFAVD